MKTLLLDTDSAQLQEPLQFFIARGDEVSIATSPTDALAQLDNFAPDLVVVDLHLLDNAWEAVLDHIRQHLPNTQFIFTSRYADPDKETQAEQYLPLHFFRQPLTRANLDELLIPVTGSINATSNLPPVKVSVRTKITFPYVVLAVLVAVAVVILVNRLVLENVEERFVNQLYEVGQLTSDLMVREEQRRLETLRLVVNTEGVATGVVARDSDTLRELILPLVVNSQEDAVELLDPAGESIISLRHRPGGNLEEYDSTKGENIFAEWPFVANVLQQRVIDGQDKFAGLARASWGDFFYVAGPLVDSDGELLGVVLIGKSLDNLARQMRRDTFAQIAFYDLAGEQLVSTLPSDIAYPVVESDAETILARQDSESLLREEMVGSLTYVEVLAPWEVQGGQDLGLVGAALPQVFLLQASNDLQLQIIFLTVVVLLAIIGVGFFAAEGITNPLRDLVSASVAVTQGDLMTEVDPAGEDEITVLSHSFNQMVSSLREGALYRNLVDRTVAPEIRAMLHQSVAKGGLDFAGTKQVATVLYGDTQQMVASINATESTTNFGVLNNYYKALMPVITSRDGLVTELDENGMLALFGMSSATPTPEESAYRACRAGLALSSVAAMLNKQGRRQGRPNFGLGIIIHTGDVTAGGVGEEGQIHYTVVGETVRVAQSLVHVTRGLGETGIVISQTTYDRLGERRELFQIEALGPQLLPKEQQLPVYRLRYLV